MTVRSVGSKRDFGLVGPGRVDAEHRVHCNRVLDFAEVVDHQFERRRDAVNTTPTGKNPSKFSDGGG